MNISVKAIIVWVFSLVAVEGAAIVGYSLGSSPSYLTNTCNSLTTSASLKITACLTNDAVLIQDSTMSEPTTLVSDISVLLDWEMNQAGTKLFLHYSSTTGTEIFKFFQISSTPQEIAFTSTISDLASFSRNMDYFLVYGSVQLELYSWNSAQFTLIEGFDITTTAAFVSDDSQTVVLKDTSNILNFFTFNTGTNLYQNMGQYQDLVNGINSCEFYWQSLSSAILTYTTNSSPQKLIYSLLDINNLASGPSSNISVDLTQTSMKPIGFSPDGEIFGAFNTNKFALFVVVDNSFFQLTSNGSQIYFTRTGSVNAVIMRQNATHSVIITGSDFFYQIYCTTCACPDGEQWNNQYCEPCTSCGTTCSPGYSWNDTTSQCQPDSSCTVDCPCDSGLEWDSTSGSCQPIVVCTSNCPCDAGKEWSQLLTACQTIDCTTKDHTVVSATGIVCECETGFIWVEAEKGCRRDCSGDSGSTGVILTNNQCQCIPYNYWNKTNSRCQPHCFRDLATGINEDNPLQCNCHFPAVWKDEIKDCYLNCVNVIHSNGQHKSSEVCKCIPPTFWNSETLTCDYNCQDISGAIVDPYDNTVCTCVSDKHFWSEQKLGCFRKCWEDPNSDGTVFANDTCGCKTNYQWDLNMARCLALNCEVIHYSTGLRVDKDCQCQTHFQWESDLRVCIIQCNTITTNAEFINPAAERVNFYECPCLENSIWDAPQLTCRRNCQLYSESTGNKNHTHCYCKIGFQWNDTTTLCETSCGQRTGELAQYDQEANHCVCDTAYYWDSLFGACYRNCSLDSNAVDVDFTNPLQCQCKRNYVWSTDQDKCVLPCSGVFDAPLTQGAPNPTTQCPCQTNAVWDTRSYMCVVQCPADPLSSGSFDFINYQCVCVQYTEWNSILNKCQCESGTVFNTQTQACDNSVSGGAVSIGIVGGTTLVGSLAFAGFKIFKKKQKKKEDQKNEQGVGSNGIETEGQMKEHHDL